MGSSLTLPDDEPERPEGVPAESVPSAATRPGPPGRRQWARRLAFWLGVAALAAVLVGVAWIAVTGLLARSQLAQARAELPRLRQAVLDGRVDEARHLAERIGTQTRRAHSLTTGPAWWVGANLPVLGSPLQTTRIITAAGDQLGSIVVPTVARVSDELARTRTGNSSIDLRPIENLAPEVHRAAGVLSRVTGRVRASDGSWFGPVSSARGGLLHQLERVDGELGGADRAIRIAVPLLGGSGPRRIFIGFLNEAEARALGGITGEYAIATADAGHVRFEHFGSDEEFKGIRADVRFDPEYEALYGQDDPTGLLQNSNVSPDFRDAARIWAGMWQAKTGQRVDAAISLDPTALGYLLDAAGPATLPSGQQISGHRIVALTESEVYARYPDRTQRKAYLSQVARAASERLLRAGHLTGLVRAAARAAGEGRLLVWSADPRVESIVLGTRYAGALPSGPAPVTGFIVTNATGSKLDYYLDRRMTYQQHGCGARATAEATFRVTNAAPAGLPAYVTVRSDTHARRAAPGDSRVLITYFASATSRVVRVEVDGRSVQVSQPTLRGLRTVTVDLELPRAATHVVTVRLTGGGDGPVRVLRQPLVRPLALTVQSPACR